MCSPVAFLAVGAGVSALSSISAGNYANNIGQFNQASLNDQAKARIEAGKVEEQKARINVSKFKGQQKASYGASGVEISTGSPVNVITDTAALGELDALTIKANASADAYNLHVKGVSAAAQGKLAKQQGYGNAAGTLLTTYGTVAAL